MVEKKLKILFVYDCIYPESLGGVEHRNYQLAKYLSKKEHLITLAGWTKQSTSSLKNVQVLPLPLQQSLYNQQGKRTALTSLKFTLAVCSLPLQNYDLIITDNIPYLHLFPLVLLSKIKQKKLIITWHEYWGKYWQKYITGLSWVLFFAIELISAQLGKKVIAVSNFTAKKLQKNRLRKNSLNVVPNGVNVEEMLKVKENLKRNGPPLIYVGRLMAEKRVDLLLKAIAKLKLDSQEIILQIIGDGPCRDNLENLAHELKIANQVKFVGRLPNIEEVWQQLAQAKIAIQPSEREGFGMFPLEAMTMGTPVIYCQSNESAVSEIVRDKIEGIGVSCDSEQLAMAMNDLLNNGEQWNILSQNAQLRSKSFDWMTITKQMECLFYDILD